MINAILRVACCLCFATTGLISFAQCNINFDFGEEPFGVSPDPTVGEGFNSGMLDEAYFDVLHILIPSTAAGIDSAYPPQLGVDSVIVMPDMVASNGEWEGVVFTDTATSEQFYAPDLGLEIVFNNDNDSPNSSTFLGGNQYCAAIQGVPNRAGVYRIAIGIEAWATLAQAFSVPYVFDNFLLRINCPLVDSIGVVGYNSVEGTSGQLTLTLAEGVSDAEIIWYNEFGNVIGTGDAVVVNESGLYSVIVNTADCSSEVTGILVEDEGLECDLSATVEVIAASAGQADGQATVNVTGASGNWTVSWYNELGLLLGTEATIEYLLSGIYSVVVMDEQGCLFEINDVDATTGLRPLKRPDWVMFPNPASNQLSFKNLPSDAVVSMHSMDGRILRVHHQSSGAVIDVSDLADGLYVVSVKAFGGVSTSAVLIRH